MFGARTHRIIYVVLLTLLGGCIVTSTWASNLVWVLLSVNWLIEGRWREKWQMGRDSRLLHAFVALVLLLAVGLLWSSNLNAGLSVLQVKLPLLVVPLILLTTQPLDRRECIPVLFIYLTAVLVVSIMSTVRLFTIPNLPYRDAVPYISHIRFALFCCMAIFICIGIYAKHKSKKLLSVAVVLLALWLLLFLLVIRSYTGFAVLLVVSLVAMLAYWRRWPLIVLWVLLVGGTAVLVGHEVRSYYRMVPMATQPLRPLTAAGNPYEHAEDGIIENGNYVNNYLCKSELRKAWNNRSTIDYDGVTASGYSVESTIVRYLNAIGQTKDSVGMMAMTDDDIRAVERGVANPVYESRNPLRKMVYVMLLEHEYYVHTHAVAGFTMLQRFELWKATWNVVSRHPALGVGTGDAVDAMHNELVKMDSELVGTTKKTHNQYLSLAAMIGLIGLALTAFMFVRAWKRPSPLMLVWLVAILVSCLTEDTLDTLAGILFCTWFLAMRNAKL